MPRILRSPALPTITFIKTSRKRIVRFRVRVVYGKRVGVAEANDLSPDGLRRVVETARAIAQLHPENPEFKGLPAPQPVRTVEAYVARTADFSPEARARVVEGICRQTSGKKLTAAGAFKTESFELAVANSLGAFAYHSGHRRRPAYGRDGRFRLGLCSAASPDGARCERRRGGA